MAKYQQPAEGTRIPINFLSILSIDAGIFGWLLGICVMLIGFTSLSNYFHFDQAFYNFLVLLPGLSWFIGIVTGILGLRQIKRNGQQTGSGPAKSGIIVSGIGCALFYGLILLGVLGFYLVMSKGYIG